MFTIICKVFRLLHSRPRTVLVIACLATLWGLVQIGKLNIKTAFSDLLPANFRSVELLHRIEDKFGGLGNLSIVISSDDPEENKRAVHFFQEHLRTHPDVNFVEFRTEADFYRQHKLLYISLADLEEVAHRVETGFWLSEKKHNPLIINLLDEEERRNSWEATDFEDLERKYFSRLQEYLGTPDGKIMVLRVFPGFNITDIQRSRTFFADVKKVAEQLRMSAPLGLQIHYSGDVIKNIRDDGRLYSGIITSGKRSLVLVALFLFLYFIRIPLGALLAGIPLLMAVIWTLGLTYATIGHLSVISASLGFVLVGLGLDASLHLLARYREERLKRFSAPVAFETIILETGPAITTSVLVSAGAFLTLLVTDFKGFAEFGWMAAMGMLCTLVACLVVFPCILIIAEPAGLIPVFGKTQYNFNLFKSRPYPYWKLHAAAVAAVTLVACIQGIQTRFEFNFDKLSFTGRDMVADSLLQRAGEQLAPPAVVMTPNHAEAQKVADWIRAYRTGDTLTPTIQTVMTLSDLLPADQEEKLALIAKIKSAVNPEMIEKAREPLRGNLIKLRESWDVRKLGIGDLPEIYRRKFLGRDSESGEFTFIFPSLDLRKGWNLIAFAEDVREIPLADTTYHASGTPVVQADLLKLIIPDTAKAAMLALLTVFLLSFVDTRSFKGAVVIVAPVLFSVLWTLGIMKWADMRLNYYNLMAFPAMLGLGINNSVHLYHRYVEEGKGSLFFVLRRTGEIISVASLVGIAAFVGFTFSDHAGLASLGFTALIGITMSLAAPLLIIPLIIGFMEEKRLVKVPEAW